MSSAPDATVESLGLFAIPIALVTDLLSPAHREAIGTWVMAERERDAGIQRSNAGGWHSRPDLPVRNVDALDRLFQAIVEQVRDHHSRVADECGTDELRVRFVLQAWATVMEAGHYVQVHDHADAHWSVVYYVDAGHDGETDAGGRIAWLNPVGPHRSMPGANLAPTAFELQPRSGTLVVFPGWLRHCVQPYRGARPRICIAGNVEVRAR